MLVKTELAKAEVLFDDSLLLSFDIVNMRRNSQLVVSMELLQVMLATKKAESWTEKVL